MNQLDEPKTMTYREAARFLGVKINSVYPLVTRGRLRPISVEGSQVKLLAREEVERYAGRETQTSTERLAPLAEEVEHHATDSVGWLADEASAFGAVFSSAWLYFHGVIDSGDTGISPRVLERVAWLRMSAEGRETLAGLAAGILATLEGEPFKSAASLAQLERERLSQLYAIIKGALAEPIKRRHVRKPGDASPMSQSKPRASGADRLAHAK